MVNGTRYSTVAFIWNENKNNGRKCSNISVKKYQNSPIFGCRSRWLRLKLKWEFKKWIRIEISNKKNGKSDYMNPYVASRKLQSLTMQYDAKCSAAEIIPNLKITESTSLHLNVVFSIISIASSSLTSRELRYSDAGIINSTG